MYERILEAIQQLREQGVHPTKIYMTTNCFFTCEKMSSKLFWSNKCDQVKMGRKETILKIPFETELFKTVIPIARKVPVIDGLEICIDDTIPNDFIIV